MSMPQMTKIESKLWGCGPWIALAIAIAFLAPAGCCLLSVYMPWYLTAFEPGETSEVVKIFITLTGLALTFAGLLLAGQRAWRGWMLDALLKLHEDEGNPEQGKAKRLIADAADKCQPAENPYTHAQKHFASLGKGTEESNEFDDARRRLAHFWLRAVKLVHWGVLGERELFNNFEPDILEKLEPFETIVAEEFRDLSEPKPWSAMELYIAWLKRKGEHRKAKEWKPTIPARPQLYQQYRASCGNEKQEQ